MRAEEQDMIGILAGSMVGVVALAAAETVVVSR
jgi:hypothetical protein